MEVLLPALLEIMTDRPMGRWDHREVTLPKCNFFFQVTNKKQPEVVLAKLYKHNNNNNNNKKKINKSQIGELKVKIEKKVKFDAPRRERTGGRKKNATKGDQHGLCRSLWQFWSYRPETY